MDDHPNVRSRRVFRNLGQLRRRVPDLETASNAIKDYKSARCMDCGRLFGHSTDCGLDMSNAALNPGNQEVAALADAKDGL